MTERDDFEITEAPRTSLDNGFSLEGIVRLLHLKHEWIEDRQGLIDLSDIWHSLWAFASDFDASRDDAADFIHAAFTRRGRTFPRSAVDKIVGRFYDWIEHERSFCIPRKARSS